MLTAQEVARHLLRLLIPVVWDEPRQRRSVVILVLMACISGVMGLVWPLATRSAVDLLVEASWSRFLAYCAILTAALASQAVVGYYSSRMSTVLVQHFVRFLRDRCYASHLAHAAFGRSETGESLVLMTSDCGRVGSLAIGIVSGTTVTLLALLGTVVAMALMSPMLLVLCAVPTLILAWVYQVMEPQLLQGSQRERVAAGRLSTIVKDHLDKATVLHGLRGGTHSLNSIRARLNECRDASTELAVTHARLQLTVSFISITGQLMVLAYGGVLFLGGAITLGTVFAFGALFSRLFGPVGSLWGIRGSLNSTAPSVERVYRSLHGTDAPQLPTVLRDIEGLLSRVRSELAPGCIVGLTGPVGAGKSTICLAMMTDTAQSALRDGCQQSVLYLPQNARLPRGTLRAVLTMGLDPDLAEASLVEALADARLIERVRALPEGLDTELGPGGVELSAGETQQLLLARSLIDSYDLIILDETTSSLDTDTALHILARLKNRLESTRGRALVVTHRSDETAVLDRRLVLEGNRVSLVGAQEAGTSSAPLIAADDLEIGGATYG